MFTRAKRRANQRNAQKSTGPKTDQGKQRCSQNALKHGLRSQHPVIPGEDPAEYQQRLDELRADLRPLNALEDSIVEQIADTSWRLKRLTRIEAAVESYYTKLSTNKEQNAGKDHDEILGDAFSGSTGLRDLAILSRYEGQLSRRFHRLTKELRDLRKTLDQNHFRTSSMVEREQKERERRKHTPQPADAENSQPAEQTQPAQAIEKSTTSGDSSVPKREPASAPLADFHRVNPNAAGHEGPQEAQK